MAQRASRGPVESGYPPAIPEEAQNTDNKNSCSPAKRKCHFYPGLVLGTTGATSPMGSGTRGSSGQGRPGKHSRDPKTNGQRTRGTHMGLGTTLRRGSRREQLKSNCGQGGGRDDMGPQCLAREGLPERPGRVPAPAGTGGRRPLKPHPQGRPPPLTALHQRRASAVPRHPGVLMPGPGTLFGPGQRGWGWGGAGPGLGERRVTHHPGPRWPLPCSSLTSPLPTGAPEPRAGGCGERGRPPPPAGGAGGARRGPGWGRPAPGPGTRPRRPRE